MANTLVGLVSPKNPFTITSDSNGPISLIGLGVSLAGIRLQSKILKNQREDGVTIAHGRIINPSTLDIDVLVQTIDGLETLNQIYRDIEGLYTITTRGIKLINMRLMNQSISQSTDVMSASPIRLSFKQALLQNDERPICQQAADSSTIDSGISDLYDFADSVETYISDKLSAFFQ